MKTASLPASALSPSPGCPKAARLWFEAPRHCLCCSSPKTRAAQSAPWRAVPASRNCRFRATRISALHLRPAARLPPRSSCRASPALPALWLLPAPSCRLTECRSIPLADCSLPAARAASDPAAASSRVLCRLRPKPAPRLPKPLGMRCWLQMRCLRRPKPLRAALLRGEAGGR